MKRLSFLRFGTCVAMASSAGCGAHSTSSIVARTDRPSIVEGHFEAFQCALADSSTGASQAIELEARTNALRLPVELDYVRIGRYRSASGQQVIAARGEPCSKASDRASCDANVESLEAAARSRPQVFAITTRGDNVELHEGDAILSFIGAIDTPERAWLALMVQQDADVYSCDDASSSGHRKVQGGIELGMLWTRSLCRPFERVRTVYFVTDAGHVTRRQEARVEYDAERCASGK